MRTVNITKLATFLIMILSLSISILAEASDQQNVKKYQGYNLHINVGEPQDNPYWATEGQLKSEKNIKQVIANFYGANLETSDIGIFGAVETKPGIYFATLSVGSIDREKQKHLWMCPVPDQSPAKTWSTASWVMNKTCGSDFLAIVNVNTNTVRRLYNPKGPNGVAQSSNNQYGCYQVFPVSTADLNLNGKQDVFFVGGQGGGVRDAKNDWSILTIFSSTTWQRLFSTRLSFDAYTEYGNKMYQYVTVGYLYGEDRIHAPKRAHREYAKLFFKDFNKDGKLDILVWRRIYESRKVTDPIKGYELTSNTYEWYEQTGDGLPFVKMAISSDLAEKWLSEKELTWKDGYPRENLCDRLVKGQPFFNDADQLNDPMIQKWVNNQH